MGVSDHQDRRKYIRLKSVFPAEIYVKSPVTGKIDVIQGFTHNISDGGVRIDVNNPSASLLAILDTPGTEFHTTISIPPGTHPIEAVCRAKWKDIIGSGYKSKVHLGVEFVSIARSDLRQMMTVSRRLTLIPKFSAAAIIILVSLLAYTYHSELVLTDTNRQLIDRFYKAQETTGLYDRMLSRLGQRYESAKLGIGISDRTIADLNKELSAISSETADKVATDKAKLQSDLAAALAVKKSLEDEVSVLKKNEAKTAEMLESMNKYRKELETAAVSNMYEWLKTHQNKFTGLVMSFEGDPTIKDWGFTYDQALASQVFLISGDTERAKSILFFFKDVAKKRKGGYSNAYHVISTNPAEDAVHAGPNLWIGIAAAQYYNKTRDAAYLGMAEDIAKWVIKLKDSSGGIKGGPETTWYSTEHNIDAYALYNILYVLTGKQYYADERNNTLRWIKEHTYSKEEERMKRGKGDSSIATDTLAWAIAAIGPDALMKAGIDPDALIRFAESECKVRTTFTRASGDTVPLTGFDFAKAKNIARGGIVSSEWTAQMVSAYMAMANFYNKIGDAPKSARYLHSAEYFSKELDKMVISSPSPSGQGAGCLPYASQPDADTGHGWRTPAGQQTGSVSGTSYTIFVKKGYNPLSVE